MKPIPQSHFGFTLTVILRIHSKSCPLSCSLNLVVLIKFLLVDPSVFVEICRKHEHLDIVMDCRLCRCSMTFPSPLGLLDHPLYLVKLKDTIVVGIIDVKCLLSFFLQLLLAKGQFALRRML
jgi:hypothetical protein